MTKDTMQSDNRLRLKQLLSEAAKAVHDLRFIQATAFSCLDLQGKTYSESRAYVMKLSSLQERLEKEMLL